MPKPRPPRRHAVGGPAAQRNLCAERIGRGTPVGGAGVRPDGIRRDLSF